MTRENSAAPSSVFRKCMAAKEAKHSLLTPTSDGAGEQRRVQLVQHRRQHPVQQQVDVLRALRALRLHQQPVRRLRHSTRIIHTQASQLQTASPIVQCQQAACYRAATAASL